PLSAFFFDCLYLNGDVLVLRSNEARWASLCLVVPETARVPRTTVTSVEQGEAGRLGAGWLKLKPAPTLDLVVLAAEWGSGRRQGWLSNLNLGARDPKTG